MRLELRLENLALFFPENCRKYPIPKSEQHPPTVTAAPFPSPGCVVRNPDEYFCTCHFEPLSFSFQHFVKLFYGVNVKVPFK